MRKLTNFRWALVAVFVLATALAPLVPTRTAYAQENDPGELLLQEQLKSIIDNRCSGQPSGTPRDSCYQGYNSWIRECNTRASESAENASGNKNDAYRDRFAQCMNNNTGSLGTPLNETAVRNALANDIYDQIQEANKPTENGETCESSGGALAWLACPLLQMIDGAAGALTDLVEETLTIESNKYENDSLTNTWRSMRNIALLILVPMMLFMVIGTALEFGPFDAYTVKKALPRMFIAVMFIVLSLEITQFFVNLSNVVGRGIEGLMLTATNSPESLGDYYTKKDGALFSYSLFSYGAYSYFTGGITLGIASSFALVTFLALLIAYIVLVLRELLILALMMIAPLAILVWIFPGNDKLWKIWRTTFTAMLMMFPLIIILITSGKIFAGLIDDTQGGPTSFFLKVIAFVGPFFLIPATFKYGLGVFGNLAGVINDRSRGIFDRQRKYREGARANARHQAMMGNRFAGGAEGNFRDKLNRGIAGGMNAPGALMANGAVLKPSKWRGAVATRTQDSSVNDVEEQLKNNKTLPSWVYNDELARIAAENDNDASTRKALTDAGYSGQTLENAAQRIEASRRSMNASTFKILTTQQAVKGGTAYKDIVAVDEDGNTVTDLDAGAAWAAVARASGNNDAAAQYLVASLRNDLVKAGRVDQGGAGFGATIGVVENFRKDLRENKPITVKSLKEASDIIHDDVLNGQGAASLVHSSMKPSAVSQMAPTLVNSIRQAQQDEVDAPTKLPQLQQQLSVETDPAARRKIEADIKRYQQAPVRFTQNLASMAAVYDSMSVSSPNKARIIANDVLSAPLEVGKMTAKQRADLDAAIQASSTPDRPATQINILQAVDASRANPEFLKMHREYGRGINDKLASMDRESAARAQEEQLQRMAQLREDPNNRPNPFG